MLKTHETVKDANINSNREPKLEGKKATASENCILRKMG